MDIIWNGVNVILFNLMVSTNIILICQVSIPVVRVVGVSGKESLDRSFGFQSCDVFESRPDVTALSCAMKEEPNVLSLRNPRHGDVHSGVLEIYQVLLPLGKSKDDSWERPALCFDDSNGEAGFKREMPLNEYL